MINDIIGTRRLAATAASARERKEASAPAPASQTAATSTLAGASATLAAGAAPGANASAGGSEPDTAAWRRTKTERLWAELEQAMEQAAANEKRAIAYQEAAAKDFELVNEHQLSAIRNQQAAAQAHADAQSKMFEAAFTWETLIAVLQQVKTDIP